MSGATRLLVSLTRDVRRALEEDAVESGRSVGDLVRDLVTDHLDLPRAERGQSPGRGRARRGAVAKLADRGGWFTTDEARAILGCGHVMTGVYLREMVDAGLLAERVVPGASGRAKEYASTERQNERSPA